MYLCSRNHEEICHEWPQCPLCEAQVRIDELVKLLFEADRDRRDAVEKLIQMDRASGGEGDSE